MGDFGASVDALMSTYERDEGEPEVGYTIRLAISLHSEMTEFKNFLNKMDAATGKAAAPGYKKWKLQELIVRWIRAGLAHGWSTVLGGEPRSAADRQVSMRLALEAAEAKNLRSKTVKKPPPSHKRRP